jgi:NAD(P)H dehydrogenase (quinone)
MASNRRRTGVFLCVLTLLAACRPAAAAPPQDGSPPKKAPPEKAVRVLVVYYSLYGNTEKFAQGVAEGVRREPGAAAVIRRVEEATKEELQAANAIALGCPTYFGNVPGKMKIVIDDWNWKWKVDFTDKVGGAFSTGAGQVGGKEFVVVSLLMFMLNNRMVVAGPLYQDAEGDDIWAEAGAAAMTGPLDPGVDDEELDAARRLGQRLARLAKKMRGKPSDPSDGNGAGRDG